MTRLPHRHAAVALGLAALVLVAGCSAAPSGGTAAGSGADRTVTVDATGRIEAEPNQATLHLSAVGTGPDAATARQRLAENASALREALRDAGVADDQVRTIRYDIYTDRRPDEGEPRSRAVHTYAVTLDDVSRVGPVIDAAVGNGASRVEQVEFGLTRAKRTELRKQAVADAMTTARGEAAVMAEASNLTITGVSHASTANVGYDGPQYDAVALAGGAASTSTRVESGPVTVTARVVVTYNATG
ncbi:MAG: SIMPL domain-containing protein [Haloferacaceae archaeon]